MHGTFRALWRQNQLYPRLVPTRQPWAEQVNGQNIGFVALVGLVSHAQANNKASAFWCLSSLCLPPRMADERHSVCGHVVSAPVHALLARRRRELTAITSRESRFDGRALDELKESISQPLRIATEPSCSRTAGLQLIEYASVSKTFNLSPDARTQRDTT